MVKHHQDLAAWLGGTADPELLDTFQAMHRPEFSLIAIDGVRLDLPALMSALTGSANAVPGLTIDIEQFEVLIQTPEVAVCRFLEKHTVETTATFRRVTAVLVPDELARYGVRWLSVHETPVL